MLTGKRYRYGYVCVNFAKPLSMREHVQQRNLDFRVLDDAARRGAVSDMGRRLMAAIGEIAPVLPVPLVASVFMQDPRRSMSELELKAAVLALIERVEALGRMSTCRARTATTC